MQRVQSLTGVWIGEGKGLDKFEIVLPGTLDTNGIGHPDGKNIESRLTRLHVYEGVITYSKKFMIPRCDEGIILLKIERSRELALRVNGEVIPAWEEGTLSTPYLFDVTKYQGEKVELEVDVDNFYSNWPRESLIGSSAATDETQTNWNGLLGDICLYQLATADVAFVRFYSHSDKCKIHLEITGVNAEEWRNGNIQIAVQSDCFNSGKKAIFLWQMIKTNLEIHYKENNRLVLQSEWIRLDTDIKMWDEEEGNLYTLNIEISKISKSGENYVLSTHSELIGVRTFGYNEEARLTINERPFFLRGETNCCVFPETGYPPFSEEEWLKVLKTYQSYGVNCVRFHSWCPPDAAFKAADKIGMMLHPELSQWNFNNAFETQKDREYYHKELYQILRWYGNHPSFVMLSFGNELKYTKEGYEDAQKLLRAAKEFDDTRLYAHSSNYRYGEEGVDVESDFYTAMSYYDEILRATSSPMIGHLNELYPNSECCYEKPVRKIIQNKKPVFGFEVGQYEILPDFSEIEQFRGITRAHNYEIVKQHVEAHEMINEWNKDVAATGELALICYREEVEAVLRTKNMSGLFLLGLQDFPGQGTALVGMLNSHLQSKPFEFAKPERFRSFFSKKLPILRLPRYTYYWGETISATLEFANYSKSKIFSTFSCVLKNNDEVLGRYDFCEKEYESGCVEMVGMFEMKLPTLNKGTQLQMEVMGRGTSNKYAIWVFPDEDLQVPKQFRIETEYCDELLKEIENGAIIFLEPKLDRQCLPNSIGGQFTTNFWSVGTFPTQEGGMGLVIDERHKALTGFPTKFHSEYQWWAMASGRPIVLQKKIKPIVRVLDSSSRLKTMGLLFEVQIGKGLLMVSSMGLLRKEYPECKGLLNSLFSYLNEVDVKECNGLSILSVDELQQIFT